MSSVSLIQPLLQGSGLLSQCSTKATKEKNARQLLGASLKFLDLARQIRVGQLKIADADVPGCLKEVSDTIAAATHATKEADYPGVVVEANEAIDVIAMHSGTGLRLSANSHFTAGALAASANPGMTIPFPEPEPFPWPQPWPVWPHPRPFPFPWPWPPGPPPWSTMFPDPRIWDQRNWNGGSSRS